MDKDCLHQLLGDLFSLKLQLDAESNKHFKREILREMITIISCVETFYGPSILKMGVVGYKYKKTLKEIANSENFKKVVSLHKRKSKYNLDEDKLHFFLSEFINLAEPINHFERPATTFSKEDYYSIIGDFFKWYNDDAFLLFKRMWKNQQIDFFNLNKWKAYRGGYYAPIRYLKKGYIFLPDTKSLFTMETIVHEIQHAFEEENSNYQTQHENFFSFCEVTTYFVELLFLNYLKENRMFFDEIHERKKMNIINTRSIAITLQDKLTMDKVIKDYYQENSEKREKTLQTLDTLKIIKILMDKRIYKTERDIINARKSDGPIDEMYLTNNLIAHKIFDLYLSDKKQSLKIIKSLSTNKDKNPIDIFNEAGINISFDSLLFPYKNYVNNVVAGEKNKEGIAKLYTQYNNMYY